MTEINATERPEDTVRRFAVQIGELEAENTALRDLTVDKLDIRPGDRIIIRTRHELDMAGARRIRDAVHDALDTTIPVLVLDGSVASVSRLREEHDDDLAARQRISELEQLAAEILDAFSDTPSGWTALASQPQLRRWRERLDQLYAVPKHTRERSRWVMNHEWWDECRKIGGGWPEAGITTMLGLPFKVTGDGGFPHLVEDWHHGDTDAAAPVR